MLQLDGASWLRWPGRGLNVSRLWFGLSAYGRDAEPRRSYHAERRNEVRRPWKTIVHSSLRALVLLLEDREGPGAAFHDIVSNDVTGACVFRQVEHHIEHHLLNDRP